MSSYKQKITFYGDTVEIKTFEKSVVTGVSRPSIKRPKRVLDLWKERRWDNVSALKRKFVQRVLSSFEILGLPLFITCTTGSQLSSIDVGYKNIRNFILRLRKRYPNVEAIVVPEFHKSGALHHHILLFGLSQDRGDFRIGRVTYSIGTERKTRELANLWRMGFLDCMRMYNDCDRTDFQRVACYLGKYMIKGSMDKRLRGRRAFTSPGGFQNHPHSRMRSPVIR